MDQMLKKDFAEILRREGHDVLRAEEVGQSRADDQEILDLAVREDRVLLTLDEHFGDWAILPLKRHSGVIRVKVHPPTTVSICELVLPLLKERDQQDFRNHLVILTKRTQRWIRTGI